MVVPYLVPFPYNEVCLPKSEFSVPGFIKLTYGLVQLQSVKFSIQQCLNSLSSMHQSREVGCSFALRIFF